MKTSIKPGLLAIGASLAMALVASCGSGGTGSDLDPETAAEVEAEEIASEAAVDFQQLVTNGNPDPIGALVASMRADPNLTDVQRHDSLGTVIATTTDGVPFAVLVAEMDRPEWHPVTHAPDAASGFGTGPAVPIGPPANAQISCTPANFPQSKKACLYRSTLTAAGAVQDQGIEASLVKAGFEIAPVTFPKTIADVIAMHQTLSTCGVLYIRAHGGAVKNLAGVFGNHFATEVTSATPAERELLKTTFGANAKQYFGKQASSRTGKTFLTLSPEFFASVQYPNSLVFTNACGSGNGLHGLVGGSVMKDSFKDHGAGAVMGWNGVVSADLAGKSANELFAALAPKVVVDAVNVTVSPPNPGAGVAYIPTATISPAAPNVDVSLSVRGTDGFSRDATGTTNASGTVVFGSIPGGAGGVTDSITVSVGGANDSQTAQNIIKNSATLQTQYGLPWYAQAVGIQSFAYDGKPNFNLVCNNPKVTKTIAVVKFGSLMGSAPVEDRVAKSRVGQPRAN